jgi:hypothetical protein
LILESRDFYDGTSKGQGADDAWWLASLAVKEAKLMLWEVMGGSADIWKCLDQILMQLLICLCKLAGMPERPIAA